MANGQHSVIQINVRETEAQRFRHAESRAIQHAEQGDECPGTQRADGRQAGGFPEQRLDLGRRVNVGAEGRDEPRRRAGDVRLRSLIGEEPAQQPHGRIPARPGHGFESWIIGHPRVDHFSGEPRVGLALRDEVAVEDHEARGEGLIPVAERLPQREELRDRRSEHTVPDVPGHACTSSGHDKPTARSCARSTFA